MKKLVSVQRTWRDLRWSENAFRFHSDLLLGLLSQLEEEGEEEESYSNGPVGIGNPPPQPGPCYPGWPCPVRTAEARKSLKELGDRVKRITDDAIDQIKRAEDAGITEIVFRPSQIPAFPEGSSDKPPAHKHPARKKSRAKRRSPVHA